MDPRRMDVATWRDALLSVTQELDARKLGRGLHRKILLRVLVERFMPRQVAMTRRLPIACDYSTFRFPERVLRSARRISFPSSFSSC